MLLETAEYVCQPLLLLGFITGGSVTSKTEFSACQAQDYVSSGVCEKNRVREEARGGEADVQWKKVASIF